jgi:hypothetical protein
MEAFSDGVPAIMITKLSMLRWTIAIILITLLIPQAGRSDIYYWTDDQGVQNYTALLDSVPQEYRSRVERLSLLPTPPTPPEPEASAPTKVPIRIPFSPGAPILVNTRINGIGPISLILDTGAERTIISPSVLSRLGLNPENAPPVILKGVTGMGQADRVWINTIEVGQSRVGPLLVAVYAADLKGAEGLLGWDFLSSLNLTIDSKEKVVILTPR